jgi:hypothetical protein
MGEIIQLGQIKKVTIQNKPVKGLRGYTVWLFNGDDPEQVQRAANAIGGARGVKYASMTKPMLISDDEGYVITGYTLDDITATLEKEKRKC